MISTNSSKVSLAILSIAFLIQSCVKTTSPTPSATTPAGELKLSEMNVQEWVSTSPDGSWVATGLVAFPKQNTGEQLAYLRLIIFNADVKTHWKVIDQWQEIGLGFPAPAPLKWSQDGQYFYFTWRVIPDGCGTFPYLTDLQQVTLENGAVKDLLEDSALAVALSPDNSQVVYFSGYQEKKLILKDLATGEEQATKIDPGKDFNVGNILWSPDGSALALTLAIDPCAGSHALSKTVWSESTTILWIDTKSLQQRILVQEDPRLFVTVEWNEPQRIVITDGEENSLWHLDVTTGEITRP